MHATLECKSGKLCKRRNERSCLGVGEGGDVCAQHRNRKSWKNINGPFKNDHNTVGHCVDGIDEGC